MFNSVSTLQVVPVPKSKSLFLKEHICNGRMSPHLKFCFKPSGKSLV